MSYVKKRAAGIAIGRKKFATEAACHRWGGGRGGRERRMNIFAAWGGGSMKTGVGGKCGENILKI